MEFYIVMWIRLQIYGVKNGFLEFAVNGFQRIIEGVVQ